ncbi:hypothetical protein [Arthrobacter rhombi]|uniref:Uncharacterized protein n=1 Tax=Arthrobacter rhombi TaxID=71253 RepID=A0A1R4G3P0_9MICC|nr:hypothetical protein [Arthrobacter rhombi]SJM62791.1 hypothetical protein FM101_07475 [Arthrobacter rhombi]
MTQEMEKAQAANLDLLNTHSTPKPDTSSIADKSTSAVDHHALITGVYVAVVQVRGDHVPPRYRRRVMFNLPSAQRAVDRATMDGLDASVVLCQLAPVGGGDHG